MANSYPKVPPLQVRYLTVQIEDISTSGQKFVVPGFRGKITKAWSALNAAISGADATLTLKIEGTSVSGGTITVAQSGSAAGDVDSTVPTGSNTFTEGDAIEVETNGNSTGTAEVVITLEVEVI